jgi:hypothetical protein
MLQNETYEQVLDLFLEYLKHEEHGNGNLILPVHDRQDAYPTSVTTLRPSRGENLRMAQKFILTAL